MGSLLQPKEVRGLGRCFPCNYDHGIYHLKSGTPCSNDGGHFPLGACTFCKCD